MCSRSRHNLLGSIARQQSKECPPTGQGALRQINICIYTRACHTCFCVTSLISASACMQYTLHGSTTCKTRKRMQLAADSIGSRPFSTAKHPRITWISIVLRNKKKNAGVSRQQHREQAVQKRCNPVAKRSEANYEAITKATHCNKKKRARKCSLEGLKASYQADPSVVSI